MPDITSGEYKGKYLSEPCYVEMLGVAYFQHHNDCTEARYCACKCHKKEPDAE